MEQPRAGLRVTAVPAYAISLTVHAERVASPRWLGDERRGTGRLAKVGDWLVTWPGGAQSAVGEDEWRGMQGSGGRER